MKEKYSVFKDFLLAIFFSLYPVLFLYSQNIGRVKVSMLQLPIFITISVSAFTFLILKVVKIKGKAISNIDLLVPIIVYFIFFYNLAHETLIASNSILSFIGKNRYFIPLIVALLGFIFYKVEFLQSKGFSLIIKIYFTVMMILPTVNITTFFLKSNSSNNSFVSADERLNINQSKNLPNIYYIILDGYTSNENLEKFGQFHNKSFTDTLINLGFYIQENASSNYDKTLFSLASTLNLDYINQLEKGELREENTELYLANNRVSEILKTNGYKYYLFDLGYALKVKYSSKDILIKTLSEGVQNDMISSPDNDFFTHFLDNSIFALLPDNYSNFTNEGFANKIKNVFKSLPSIASIEGRKFVFAHIISPHPPFIFDSKGNYRYKVSSKAKLWKREDYIEQLNYINTETLKAINLIIKNDKSLNKMIIIQGDHGSRTLNTNTNYSNREPWVTERYGIFNAIYINANDSLKKKTLENWKYSSVNTFRIILNNYFQINTPILPDKKYYTNINTNPYKFYEIKE